MEGISDATWSRGIKVTLQRVGHMDVYTLAIIYRGAAVLIVLKKCPIMGGSSAEVEGLALLKLSDYLSWGEHQRTE